MSYDDARSTIQTTLAGLAITSPLAQSIKKIYADPPATVQDLPCYIMYGSSGSVEWVFGGSMTLEEHTERLRLLVYDSDSDRAANLVRAYRAAMITAFAALGGLSGNGLIRAFVWEEPSSFTYGGREYTGQDALITVLVPR